MFPLSQSRIHLLCALKDTIDIFNDELQRSAARLLENPTSTKEGEYFEKLTKDTFKLELQYSKIAPKSPRQMRQLANHIASHNN